MPASQEEIHKICVYLQSNAKCFESVGPSTNNSKTAKSLCSMVAKRPNLRLLVLGGSCKIRVESYCQTELSDLGMVTGQISLFEDKRRPSYCSLTLLQSN